MDEVIARFNKLLCSNIPSLTERGRTRGSGSNVFSDVGEGGVQAVHLVKHYC